MASSPARQSRHTWVGWPPLSAVHADAEYIQLVLRTVECRGVCLMLEQQLADSALTRMVTPEVMMRLAPWETKRLPMPVVSVTVNSSTAVTWEQSFGQWESSKL